MDRIPSTGGEVDADASDAGACDGPCPPPAPDDGIKNGTETDVDCGGDAAPKCQLAQGCLANADCALDACSYAHVCIAAKSCTGHAGGDTCGAGETGGDDAAHESCCAEIEVADRPAEAGGPFAVDKYHVTSGRVRAFVERWNGNLQAWAATNPPGWDPTWTSHLPDGLEAANFALSPYLKAGCSVPGNGGRTYWESAADLRDSSEVSDFSKELLDEKAMNCISWHMAAALCVSDGRRLAFMNELAWEFENRGFSPITYFPWGDTPLQGDATAYMIYNLNYRTPAIPQRFDKWGVLDRAYYIAPPGRRPLGASRHGVMDIAGNMLHWTWDAPMKFTWTMSWQGHGKQLAVDDWANTGHGELTEGYYAMGARCARSL